MRTTTLLPLLLCLAGCASWTFVSAEPHAALAPGAQLVVSERGRGAEHERRVEIRSDGGDVSATTVDRVMKFARPIDSPETAIAYSALVRELGVTDVGVTGAVVRPDAALEGPGSGGRYSRRDADAWGIAFEPSAKPYAGGFEVTRVVLLAPVPHPVLRGATPWRLVLVREVVRPDGTIRAIDEKTLTNGQDAQRFAAY